ncbi:LuxR C-terminal-related transcriptional regulator [Microbispora rosea]|uniref:AAA family ATPase n=1 Tax=Microbispora rosea TaxID=58117 RepID=UPI003415C998
MTLRSVDVIRTAGSHERGEIVGRRVELDSLSAFMDEVPANMAACLIEGEAGVGKSTLWRAGVAIAQRRGHQVLACAPAEAETRLAYSALGDLLDPVPPALIADLPMPQRLALDAVLLLSEPDVPLHERAVAMGFLSILRLLALSSPVLVAVDDAQWLDAPSARVLAYACRRLMEERVAVLACARTDFAARVAADLERNVGMARLRRLSLGPVGPAALHRVLRDHLGVSLPRHVLLRIRGVTRGNVFHAMEIARVLASRTDSLAPNEALPVPVPLRKLVAQRVATLPERTREALLAASALARPTVELVQAVNRKWQGGSVLEPAERAELITLDGDRLRFTHPLIASALYAGTTPDGRRELHGRLAQVVADVEERARHVALSAVGLSETVAAVLDDAAVAARARGAPAAAAELYELAGGSTPAHRPEARRRRRIDAAECHFMAGDLGRARLLLEEIVAECPTGLERARVLHLLGEVRYHDDSFPEAARLLRLALAEAGEDLAIRVTIERDLAYVTHTHQDMAVAAAHARAALEAAEEHGEPGPLAEAMASVAITEFLLGQGFNERQMQRALALEDVTRSVSAPMRPSVIHGMLMFLSGRPRPAHASLERLRGRLVERGDETALPFVVFMLAFEACARGDVRDAERYAAEGLEAAATEETDVLRAHLLTASAVVDAYLGRTETARSAAEEAVALFDGVGCPRWAAWPRSVLGFLHLSNDDPSAAVRTLSPLITSLTVPGSTELVIAPFPPDAVEALVAVGDLRTAESALECFERRGALEDRPWALATSRRCRGLLLAARGDLHGGLAALEQALVAHERLPHPVDLARTLLVLGGLQRRANRRREARRTLERALAIFGEVGAEQWARRTRAELTRLGSQRPGGSALTPREEQVARWAATGATNREIAAALLVSPKTVEANLARAYRKLGIRSRAQLGALMTERQRADQGDT